MVLPPWGRLYHWQSPDIHQVRIPWSDFFDLESLNKNIPVMEYEEFIAGEAVLLVWTAAGQAPRGCPLGRVAVRRSLCSVEGPLCPFVSHRTRDLGLAVIFLGK